MAYRIANKTREPTLNPFTEINTFIDVHLGRKISNYLIVGLFYSMFGFLGAISIIDKDMLGLLINCVFVLFVTTMILYETWGYSND